MHSAGEVFAGQRRRPGFIRSAASTDLCDDHQVFRVGVDSLADDLVGDMGAIIVASVDMVHSQSNGLPHHGHGGLAVPWRAKGHRAGELHGAIPHAVESDMSAVGRERAGKIRRLRHAYSPVGYSPVALKTLCM